MLLGPGMCGEHHHSRPTMVPCSACFSWVSGSASALLAQDLRMCPGTKTSVPLGITLRFYCTHMRRVHLKPVLDASHPERSDASAVQIKATKEAGLRVHL